VRELRVGEDVLARDGSRLGTLERLVVDADAHRITHIVVHGRLLGLGRLRDAGPDGLASDLTSEELQRLPEAHDELVGPHLRSMYQIAFPRALLASFLPWLMLNRDGLTVLLHPGTGNPYADHTDHAAWLGGTLPLRLDVLDGAPRKVG